MTYTLAIRSPQTNQIGVGITTCSIAFGGQAPFYTNAGDLIVSQAFASDVLANAGVLEAMAESVHRSTDLPLGERLLLALEAGRDAGGQAAGGAHLTERSAMLKITRTAERPGFPELDLRVDLHASALHEMRRLLPAYTVYNRYSKLRDQSRATAPSMAEYEAANQHHDGQLVQRPSIFR